MSRKKAESSIPDGPQQRGTCSGNKENQQSMCRCVCEPLLPSNKRRVIGVAGPPEGKARVMTEGGREGQNEKKEEEEEEQGHMRCSFPASR